MPSILIIIQVEEGDALTVLVYSRGMATRCYKNIEARSRTLGGQSGCHSFVARGLPNGAVSLYRGKDSWRRASPAGHDSSAGEYRVRCGLQNGGKLGHQSGRHGGTTWKLGTLDMKERQTDRQTDRRTDGRTDRHTEHDSTKHEQHEHVPAVSPSGALKT